MEIGQQRVHDPEAVAGIYKDIGLALERRQPAPFCCRRFKRPHHRRADGHDTPAGGARGIHLVAQRRGKFQVLGVHPVFGEVFAAHRLEGAGADMQREPAELDAQRLQPCEQGFVEVQAGGGCGDRAGRARVDRLVAVAVHGFVAARNVWRQWHVAGAFQLLDHRVIGSEIELVEFAPAAKDTCRHPVLKVEPLIGLWRLTGAYLRQCFVRV